jgi:hypothetical protein
MFLFSMKKIPGFLLGLKYQVLVFTTLGTVISHAAVLENNVTVSSGVFGPDTYLVNPLNSAAGFVVTKTGNSVYQITTFVIAEGFAYYNVTQGTLIDMDFVLNATPLVSNVFSSTIGNSFNASSSSPLLLGYWDDSDHASQGLSPMDDWGWVELTEIDGNLAVLRSASAVGTKGIYAGTLATVPEPSGLFLTTLGGFLLMRRKRQV